MFSLGRLIDKYRQTTKERRIEKHYKMSAINHLKMLRTWRPLSSEQKEQILSVWGKYGKFNYEWFSYFQETYGEFDPYFVPTCIWDLKVCDCLNQNKAFKKSIFGDKNYFDVLLSDVKTLPILVRNINGQFLDKDFRPLEKSRVLELCCSEPDVVIKPSLASARARNIGVFSNENEADFLKNVSEHMEKLKKDYVIQPYFRQHERMAALNTDSVNTIRVYSLMLNNQVHVLRTVVRIGTKGIRVDNLAASHGVICNINSNGCFDGFASDYAGNKCTVLPSGVVLKDYAIPSYDAVVEMVKFAHFRLSHCRLLGWDISVDREGNPVVVEVNIHYPCSILGQVVSGPMLGKGELFKEVMDFVSTKVAH